MRLIGRSGSSATYRLRIALALKGVGPETVRIVHLRDGEHRDPHYRAINPQMRLPCLVTDRGPVVQSAAILEYIDEVYPDPPLLPPDPWDRALARGIGQIVVADVHPLQNTGVLEVMGRDFGLGPDRQQAWARIWIRRGLEACEALLADNATGRFAVGDMPGLADICLVPQVRNAGRFGVEIGDLHRLNEVVAACLAHPAFAAAHPDRHPNPDD